MNIKIKEPDEHDQATQYFTTLIQDAAWYSIPTSTNEIKNTCNILLHIRGLVAEKRRASSRWQMSRNNEDRINYNRLKRRLYNTLANTRNVTFEQYVTSLSKDDHTIWKATKIFKRHQLSIPPMRKADRSWAKCDSEKAETFGEHLSQVFTPHDSNNRHKTTKLRNF
jgi:hypothetical protein